MDGNLLESQAKPPRRFHSYAGLLLKGIFGILLVTCGFALLFERSSQKVPQMLYSPAKESADLTGYVLPSDRAMCMQGTKDYLENDFLKAMKASNMGEMYSTTKEVTLGECKDIGYDVRSIADPCFPGVTTFFPKNNPLAVAAALTEDQRAMVRTIVKHPERWNKAPKCDIECPLCAHNWR